MGRQPFVAVTLQFPALHNPNRSFGVHLLVDTGADLTLVSPSDAIRLQSSLGIVLASLRQGPQMTGIGGSPQSRLIEATLNLPGATSPVPFSSNSPLHILEQL